LVNLIALIGRFQLFILSVIITEKGTPAPTTQAPVLVVAPHSTIVDGFFMLYHGQKNVLPAPISATENQKLWIVGRLLKVVNPVFVTRTDSNSKKHTIQEITRRANLPQTYPQTMIFPEGTNTNQKSLIKFKPGAFIPGVPVQPVLLRFRMWDTITWTFNGSSMRTLIFLTLCQFYISMEVEYLPVYVPNQMEKKDAMLYADNVRDSMAKALNVPATNLCYENGILYELAIKLELPSETACFNFYDVTKETKYGLKDLKKRLREFAALRCAESNRITRHSLHQKLFLPDSQTTQQLDKSLSLTDTTALSFVDYAIIFSTKIGPNLSKHSSENIFQCLNLSCHVDLTKDDFDKVFENVFSDVAECDRELCTSLCWKKLSEEETSNVKKTDFISMLENRPIYVHLFNLVTINPPKVLQEKLKMIIQ